jgi:hypothetical protein
MNKHSASLAIRKMQIKTTLKFYLTPVRMAIKKTTKAGGDAGVKGALLHHW